MSLYDFIEIVSFLRKLKVVANQRTAARNHMHKLRVDPREWVLKFADFTAEKYLKYTQSFNNRQQSDEKVFMANPRPHPYTWIL